MKIIVNDRYTYESDIEVEVGDVVILPAGRDGGDRWAGYVTSIAAKDDRPLKKIICKGDKYCLSNGDFAHRRLAAWAAATCDKDVEFAYDMMVEFYNDIYKQADKNQIRRRMHEIMAIRYGEKYEMLLNEFRQESI